MDILFVSVALTETGTATGILIGNMIEELHALGHNVAGLGIKRSLYDLDITEYRGALIYHADYVTSFRNTKKRGKDFWLAASRRIFSHSNKNKKSMYDARQVKALVKKMREINAEKYDAIVAVCASYDAIKAVQVFKEKFSPKSKCVLIQYDPLLEHFYLKNKDYDTLAEYEKDIFSKCASILTAPFVLNGRDKHSIPENLTLAELPAIIERTQVYRKENRDELLCVFAGGLFPGMRDPQPMLKLFSLFDDPKIKLHIIGAGSSLILNNCIEGTLKDKVFVHDRMPEDECNDWIARADVLVNLGNNINNQLPSKVLNYICYGKTILNIYAIPDCPTLEYLEKYPLCINVDANQKFSEDTVGLIKEKIYEFAGKQLDFSEISKLYYKCEPRYVVRQLLDTINRPKES
jgi:hypothetical protein